MAQFNPPIPMFDVGNEVLFHRSSYKVLSVNTYCVCCDRSLEEATYSILGSAGTVKHKVTEAELEIPNY